MITTKLYEDQEEDLVAIVFEDGQYSNYVPCPEIAAIEADSFLEEARLGFPDALPYEYDSFTGLSMEEAAAKIERTATLVAQVGEKIIIYPRQMSQEHQELFQIELGEDVWQELLERVSGNEGIEVDM